MKTDFYQRIHKRRTFLKDFSFFSNNLKSLQDKKGHKFFKQGFYQKLNKGFLMNIFLGIKLQRIERIEEVNFKSLKSEEIIFLKLFFQKYGILQILHFKDNSFIIGHLNRYKFRTLKIPCFYFSYIFNYNDDKKIKKKYKSFLLLKNIINIREEDFTNTRFLKPVIRTKGYDPLKEWVSGKSKYNLEREQKKYLFKLLILKKEESEFQKIIRCKQLRYNLPEEMINLWKIIFDSPLSEVFYYGDNDDFKFCWFLNLSDRKLLFQLGAHNGIGAIDFLYFNLKNMQSLIDFGQGNSIYKDKLSNCEIDNFSFYY